VKKDFSATTTRERKTRIKKKIEINGKFFIDYILRSG
jgi:hypothetical protein